jgi:hypothetical protein
MEDIVSVVVQENPNLIDAQHAAYLGPKEHIVAVMSASISVAHWQVKAGQDEDREVIPNSFNMLTICHQAFKVTTGGEVWVGCNEAGVLAGFKHDNPCEFTHVVECRHDFDQREIRGWKGIGPHGYDGRVGYHTFDINSCLKVRGGCKWSNDLNLSQVDKVYEFLVFVADALLKRNAKVLLHCTLAAWVNETASLLPY